MQMLGFIQFYYWLLLLTAHAHVGIRIVQGTEGKYVAGWHFVFVYYVTILQ